MKTPTKAELYAQISELEKQNAKLNNQLEAEKREKWQKLIPSAVEVCQRQLNAIFPGAVVKLHYEHVDEGGYWFSFELVNDDRRQAYAVRHSDLEQED